MFRNMKIACRIAAGSEDQAQGIREVSEVVARPEQARPAGRPGSTAVLAGRANG